MLGRKDSESAEPLRGRLGAVCTAKSGAKAPGVERAAAARTEMLQLATSPGTERGSDEGSGEHEGQWQTVRREEA